ncbi:hypothetical protein BDV33DRAFT_210705 [Aspergillus novoparasiticus]|uniref:Response regulatory domain-containing protein n=1 Tax=Aspergillus novoparasiticus TaxID=986946 RepID=A0A5N6E7Z0_9EURO|nr:hypothetical protein BDV33DRAFT_210705 [Aspergillus novoparasiticus]
MSQDENFNGLLRLSLKLRILVADDEFLGGQILCRRLETVGHRVHLTRDGKEFGKEMKLADLADADYRWYDSHKADTR